MKKTKYFLHNILILQDLCDTIYIRNKLVKPAFGRTGICWRSRRQNGGQGIVFSTLFNFGNRHRLERGKHIFYRGNRAGVSAWRRNSRNLHSRQQDDAGTQTKESAGIG